MLAQVEYSQAGMGNGLWIMPERYYTHTFEFGTQTAQFVVRDMLCVRCAQLHSAHRLPLSLPFPPPVHRHDHAGDGHHAASRG